ncbi:hypothetical protein NUACC21_15130 [Scytonema sp. NUACC21]
MITLGSDDSYEECDSQNYCFTLYGSQSMSDRRYNKKQWKNGEYTYAVFWREGKGDNMRLNILKGDRRIYTSELIPVAELKRVISCNVTGIYTGQLPVRFSPRGKSKAGLNNGNTVRAIQKQNNWMYVEVEQGSNPGVKGVRGWVNSDYLTCTKSF